MPSKPEQADVRIVPKMMFALFAGFFFLCSSATLLAHNPDTSYAKVTIGAQGVVTRLTLDLFTLQQIADVDHDKDARITREELRLATPAIERFLRANVHLEINGLKSELGRLGEPGWPEGKGDFIKADDWHTADGLIHFTFTRPAIETPQTVAFSFDYFDSLSPRHIVLGSFEYNGASTEVTFTQPEPDYIYDTGFTPSIMSRLWAFFKLGVKHIFQGYDHFCFLLALLVASRFREIPAIITAFTAAHTVTLILTATGLVTFPARWVEAAIALTIVYVAAENLARNHSPKRWRLAFLFGLIHGFGFASLLKQLGLPTGGMIRSLLTFNVGVEVAQLGIALALLPATVWLFQSAHGSKVKNIVSIIISLLGLVWFSARAFNLSIPGFA